MINCSEFNRERKSGIELLKLISMFLIVLSHVISTIGLPSESNPQFNSIVIDLRNVTDNTQYFMMAVIWHYGQFAVSVFFVVSSWFLCYKDRNNLKRIITLVLDVWIISIMFLLTYLIIGVPVSKIDILKSILPNISGNNWFITCYIFLLLLHPFLNLIICHINRRLHFLIVIFGFFYCMITYVSEFLLFYSKLIIAVIIYVAVAYIKKYDQEHSNNIRLNAVLFFFSLVCNYVVLILINMLGKRFGGLSHMLLHTNVIENPFTIIMAVTAFNIFRQMDFVNRKINYLASLTFYMYIIHENLLFRNYSRPLIWIRLIDKYGYERILPSALLFAIVLYFSVIIISVLYKQTIGRSVSMFSEKIYEYIEEKYRSY